MTKPVRFSNGFDFAKAGDATAYFKTILNTSVLRTYLVGPEREAVEVLFRDYCVETGRGKAAAPENYFVGWNRAEGRTTRSFFVEYDDGATDDFSYLKAVRAVANRSRRIP